MSAKLPNCYRRSDGTYYARFILPKPLKMRFPALPREFRCSLRTKQAFDANQRSLTLRQIFPRLFQTLADTPGENHVETGKVISRLKQLSNDVIEGNHTMPLPAVATHNDQSFFDDGAPLNLTEITLPNGMQIRSDYNDPERECLEIQNLVDHYAHKFGGGDFFNGHHPLKPKIVRDLTKKFIENYREESEANDESLAQAIYRIERVMGLLPQDKMFHTLTSEDIESLRPIIRQLPDARNGKGKSKKLIGGTTAVELFNLLKSACQYAVRIDAHYKDIAYSIKMSATAGGSINPAKRPGFTRDDIQKIFNGYVYSLTPVGRAENLFAYHFWLPLLYAFTGARLNEMTQLRICDVCYAESVDIWYLNVMAEGEGQSVKNIQSKRPVPVHDTLIKLGFLDFVLERQREAKSEDPLFEGLYWSKQNKWGKKFQDWFLGSGKRKSYLSRIGLDIIEGKVVHSFRHTTVTVCRSARMQKIEIDQIIGHLNESTNAMYGEWELEPLQEIINQIDYRVDLSHISWPDYKEYMKRKGKAPTPPKRARRKPGRPKKPSTLEV